MKKLVSLTLALILITTGFYSCNNSDLQVGDNSEIKVIYERQNKQKISNSIFADHLTKVEEIGSNSAIGADILSVLRKNKSVNLSNFNTQIITRFSFDHTKAQMLSLKSKSNINRNLIIYTDGVNYKYAMANYESGSNISNFSLKDLNGKLVYTLGVNQNNAVGNVKVGGGDLNFAAKIDGAVKKDAQKRDEVIGEPSQENPGDASCPDQTDTFTDCLQCGFNECSSDWLCTATMIVAGPQVLAGFALGCAID